ncbi:MAG: hypothetical protein GOVbin1807_90 [Prokaryotic dsDNA virus sp.]|nr:MAG: hypothetical protein GOVbin1807_90 [Prokaryotic dsDNA virus sp.]|tara:strand:- start:1145 stop:1639 length:495 start_codon:yes stop_codon:yes gene_type:complete
MSDDNKWSKPDAPPPPLFLGEKERNLVKQVNDEVIERVVGQQILYFPIDIEHTNYHPVYGEAVEKTFLPPVRVYALVEYGGVETAFMDGVAIDKKTTATVKFHKRRLTEDQNLFVREGDFIRYGTIFYEIVKTNEPKQLFGQIDHKFEIIAECIRARDGLFNAE